MLRLKVFHQDPGNRDSSTVSDGYRDQHRFADIDLLEIRLSVCINVLAPGDSQDSADKDPAAYSIELP